MSRAAICAGLLLLLAAAAPAAAALPKHGKLVPGTSLGGIRIGETAAQVEQALGGHGVCKGCAVATWYFNVKPFDQHGLAVELTRGRVSGVFTIWQPDRWTGPNGIVLGSFEGEATSRAGALLPGTCPGYIAYYHDAAAARTVYYVLHGKLWGFGLFRRGADPCR